MARLVIKGCEFDPAQEKDIVFGDSFRMDLGQAMELTEAGVEFWAAGPGDALARVTLGENEFGERILKTDSTAWAANHLGQIEAPPIVHPRYRASIASRPVIIQTGLAVAA